MEPSSNLAIAAKSEGAEAFKAGDYGRAASLFMRAIELGGADSHLLYSNRSAALMSATRYSEALQAAEAALQGFGGKGFIKGHYRRAIALEALERWEEASHVCQLGIELAETEGDSSSLQLCELKRRCQERMATQREGGASTMSASMVATEVEQMPADSKDTALASSTATAAAAAAAAATAAAATAASIAATTDKARAAEATLLEAAAKRRELAEEERRCHRALEDQRKNALAAELLQQHQELHAEAKQRRREATRTACAEAKANPQRYAAKAAAAAVVEVTGNEVVPGAKLSRSLASGGEGLATTVGTNRAEEVQAHARVGAWRVKQLPTRKALEAPRTPSEFTKAFALLRKDSAALFSYIRLVDPATCSSIFKPEIAAEVLLAVARAITESVDVHNVGWCVLWLGQLREVGRFDMTVLMLDKRSQAQLCRMFEALEASAAESTADALTEAEACALLTLPVLRTHYGIHSAK